VTMVDRTGQLIMSMRCLLISPQAEKGEKPAGGEDTYTRMLLRYPPPGIEYIYYKDLVRAGAATRIWLGPKLLLRCAPLWSLSPDIWLEFLDTDLSFDLVHIHGYSVWFSRRFRRSLRSQRTPIVMSTSSSSAYDLVGYLAWPERRARRAYAVKKVVFKSLGIYDHHVNFPEGSVQLVWSEFAKRLHGLWGPPKKSVVIPPPVELPPLRNGPPHGKTCRLLFVGADFERKGGDVLLEAYREVKQKMPQVELLIVGPPQHVLKEPVAGVRCITWIPTEQLHKEIFPKADVFVLPSRAEGYGMSALEAMAHGIPVVASSVGALPEIIRDGVDGYLVPPGDVASLRDGILALAGDTQMRTAMGRTARARVQQHLSVAAFQTRLGELYQTVVGLGTWNGVTTDRSLVDGFTRAEP
jgi:glycosyltransferase involved in cell wall biosynthesis